MFALYMKMEMECELGPPHVEQNPRLHRPRNLRGMGTKVLC